MAQLLPMVAQIHDQSPLLLIKPAASQSTLPAPIFIDKLFFSCFFSLVNCPWFWRPISHIGARSLKTYLGWIFKNHLS